MEKLINISFDSPLFPFIQNVLREIFKDYSAEKSEKIIKTPNFGTYKFVVEWQDENQSCFDIFKVMETL